MEKKDYNKALNLCLSDGDGKKEVNQHVLSFELSNLGSFLGTLRDELKKLELIESIVTTQMKTKMKEANVNSLECNDYMLMLSEQSRTQYDIPEDIKLQYSKKVVYERLSVNKI